MNNLHVAAPKITEYVAQYRYRYCRRFMEAGRVNDKPTAIRSALESFLKNHAIEVRVMALTDPFTDPGGGEPIVVFQARRTV